MRTIVIWGAGRIGRGFVADIFREADDFRTVFVDVDRSLVDALNAAGSYTVAKATRDGISEIHVKDCFTAMHTSDTARLEKLFSEKDLLLDIAVHEPKLEEVADMLCPFFEHRAQAGLNMDVMMNVNMARPDECVRALMRKRLSSAARAYFDQSVGVTGIFAMCISPAAPEWLTEEDPLALWNNGWPTQTISRSVLKCSAPAAPRLLLTEDIEREETRKLYTLNMAHAFLCYLGLPRGLRTSLEAVRDGELRTYLLGALDETAEGLKAEFGFGGSEMDEWSDTIVSLLENPYIEDGLQRLGADTRRKLSCRDRLVGPARLCMKAGKAPENIARAVRAGFDYENDDEGTREVRAFFLSNGLEAAIERYCGLDRSDPLFRLITKCCCTTLRSK